MTTDIEISGIKIGPDHPPFIIAEMSGNHNQSLDRAIAIVEAAAKSGAHALKLQTYTADTMTLNIENEDFVISNPNSPWEGANLYKLYQDAHTPWEWHRPIFERCRELGLVYLSTPFDDTSVDFLESLNVPCYKIASFENTDIPLIRKVASTGKPIIISTGMATVSELDESIRAAREAGCKDIILLKCTSSYPAPPENSNIFTIPHMRELFGVQVGLSDHTLGIGVAVASVALGATVIEKHITISRSDGGVDSSFSLEPDELNALVVETERAWNSLGKIHYGPSLSEKSYMYFRRSLYVTVDMQPGDLFSKENLKPMRPGLGLAPVYQDIILGKRASRFIRCGTPISWDLVS